MFPRVALSLACWLALSQTASARQIVMTCNVTADHTGEQMRRSVRIDTDARIVHDNTMTFIDGITSPLAPNLEEFVEVNKGVATWGNRKKTDKAGAGVFTLNLANGNYVMFSRIRGRLHHGTCQSSETST